MHLGCSKVSFFGVVVKIIVLLLPLLILALSAISLQLNVLFNLSYSTASVVFWECVQKISFIISLGAIFLLWLIGLFLYFKSEKQKKYFKIDHVAGLISVPLFALSIILMAFFKNDFSLSLFVLSGVFSVYVSFVELYRRFRFRTSEFAWESFVLVAVFGGIVLYLLSGYASIDINAEFKVDASYFPFTKPVAMFLVLAPYLPLLSMLAIVLLFMRRNGKKTSGQEDFYDFNFLISCYFVLVICTALEGYHSKILEIVATKFDFDSKTHCEIDIKNVGGVIVLDPAHTKALIYAPDLENKYTIEVCK